MSLQETVQVQTMMRGKLRESDPVPVDIPITLPEDLLRYLFCDVGLRIPECEIQKYWKHTRDTNCPWSGMSEGDHIPCAIYGDSAKFSLAGEKVTCIFFSLPLWNPRAARRRIWLLCAIETFRMLGGRTLFPIYRRIVQSMWQLYEHGLQVDGKTLRFCVTELKGDWEWHYDALSLKRSWRNSQFCWRCEASKTAQSDGFPSYLDFRERPDWEEAQLTHTEFLARCISIGPAGSCELAPTFKIFFFQQICVRGTAQTNMDTWMVIPSIFIRSGPLILLPKFHYSMVRHCSMHNVNLGIAAVANGSALLLMGNLSPFFFYTVVWDYIMAIT